MTGVDAATVEKAVRAGLKEGWHDVYSIDSVVSVVTRHVADALAPLFQAQHDPGWFDLHESLCPLPHGCVAHEPGEWRGLAVTAANAGQAQHDGEDVRAAVDRVARLLCERHQFASPTRQPCAACVQDAEAALSSPAPAERDAEAGERS